MLNLLEARLSFAHYREVYKAWTTQRMLVFDI